VFRVEVAGRGALACVNSTELFRKHVACVNSTDLFANIGSQFTVASHPQNDDMVVAGWPLCAVADMAWLAQNAKKLCAILLLFRVLNAMLVQTQV